MTKRRNLLLAFIVIAFAFTITTTQTAEAKAKLKVTAPKKIEAGKKAKVKANLPSTFKSSDKNVAIVNKKGVVTAKKVGTVKITITSKKDKALKKTVKIIVTKPDDPVQPEPSAEGTLSVEYKGKCPKNAQYNICEEAVIAKIKQSDGTEQILDPEDYKCYYNFDADTIQRGDKEFAPCIIEYNGITTDFEVELIDVGNEIPVGFFADYPKDKKLQEGEEPSMSDVEATLYYNDRSEILKDNSVLSFGRMYNYYTVIYEKTYNYNGEEVYVYFYGIIYVH